MKDGMDISLVSIDRKKNMIRFAGAHNSLYLFRENNMIKVEADKYPIGGFVDEKPHHPYYIEDKEARVTSDILKVMQPEELADTRLNHEFRKSLLYAYEKYYSLHIHDFGTLRSLPVLSELFS